MLHSHLADISNFFNIQSLSFKEIPLQILLKLDITSSLLDQLENGKAGERNCIFPVIKFEPSLTFTVSLAALGKDCQDTSQLQVFKYYLA